jgi:hypothetical protein
MNKVQILLISSAIFGAFFSLSHAETHLSGSNDILSNNENMIILPDGKHVASMQVSDQKKAEIARDKEYNNTNYNVSNYYPSEQLQSENNSTPQTESNPTNNDNSNDSPIESSDTSLDNGSQSSYNNNGEQYPPYYPPYNPPQPTPVSQNYVETKIAVKDYQNSAFTYNQNESIQFDFLNDFTISQSYPSTMALSTLKICSDRTYSNCSQAINVGSKNTFTLSSDILKQNKRFIADALSEEYTKFYVPVFYFIATDKNNVEYRFDVDFKSYGKSQISCSLKNSLPSCMLLKGIDDKQDIALYTQ